MRKSGARARAKKSKASPAKATTDIRFPPFAAAVLDDDLEDDEDSENVEDGDDGPNLGDESEDVVMDEAESEPEDDDEDDDEGDDLDAWPPSPTSCRPPSAFTVTPPGVSAPGPLGLRMGLMSPSETSAKRLKPGIIYLSSIPPGYNVSQTTTFFSQYGQVGRVFLQPDMKEKARSKDKVARNFTEGWIEFTSKRVAKNVAENLNTTQVGGKKRSKAHDVLWNIKYLPSFKWTHLTERLAYEKAMHHHKMRAEVSQAKREADYFRTNVEKSKRLEKLRKRGTEAGSEGGPAPPKKHRAYEFRQKETEEAARRRRREDSAGDEPLDLAPEPHKPKPQSKAAKSKKKGGGGGRIKPAADRTEFLQSVFGGGTRE